MFPGDPPKLDAKPVLGLLGVSDSLAYKVHEIEKHLHTGMQSFGATAVADPTFLRGSVVPITIAAGNGFGVWGTEVILYRGNNIEGGSSTMKFDLHWGKITNVGTANSPAFYEFNSFAIGTPKAATMVAATNKVTDATNTVANNDKVYFPTIASNTGVVVYEVYYVINRAAGDFEVSRTRAGAAADITGVDGACTYVSLGASTALGGPGGGKAALQTWITDWMVNRAAVTTDATPSQMQHSRLACNQCISARGYGAAANSVSTFFGLHSYVG
jgi:hypothetical protein